MTGGERLALLDSYADGPGSLTRTLRQIPRRMWHSRPLPGRRSTHEIILTLADWETDCYVRCRQFAANPAEAGASMFAGTPTLEVEHAGSWNQSTREALDVIRLVRKMTLHILKSSPGNIWAHTVQHPVHGALTLESWLQIQEQRIPIHIEQIKQNYKAWVAKNPPRRLNTRAGKRSTPDPVVVGAD